MYTVLPRASIRRLPLALLGAIAVLTGCGQAPKQTGTDQVPDSNVALAAAKDGKFNTLAWPMVDEILIDWLDGPFAPGCAVGVSIDDEVVYLKGYGRSRLGLDAQDWGVQTMGAIGSVSKTFTAMAAMHQREQGWADFEDQVKDRLPINGALGNAMLIRLLSHGAGAGGGSRAEAFAPNWDAGSPMQQCANVVTPDPADPFCTEAHRAAMNPAALAASYNGNEANNVFALATVDDDGNGSPDGWQAIYSNVGYQVAGGMVGAVAQAHGYAGYEDYVWKEIGRWSDNPLMPGQATSLAITHEHRADDIPNRAVGYYDGNWGAGAKNWTQGDPWEVTTARASWFGPSGGWAITIGDFTRLLAAYRSNQIVNANSRHWMELRIGHLDQGPDPMNLPPYGLGLIIDDVNGSRYHGGDIGLSNGNQRQSTNSAVWSLWPEAIDGQDVGVALMCNNGRGSGSLYSIAKDVVEAIQDSPSSRPVTTQTHATAPDQRGVDRRRYTLDSSEAYVLLPDGLPMLPGLIQPLSLEANLANGVILWREGGGQAGSTAGALGNTRLSTRGRLEASGGMVSVRVGQLPLRLQQAAMSFQVANDGTQLYDGQAQAIVDARDVAPLAGLQSPGQVCEAVAAAGSDCRPCDDGAKLCFGAALGGLTAVRDR